MARPPQYRRPDDPTRDPTAVKAAIKRLDTVDRAQLIAWLLLYYDDKGELFASRRRKRITLEEETFWLVKTPTNK